MPEPAPVHGTGATQPAWPRSTMSQCRFCDAPLTRTLVDLGVSPLSNAFVDPASADRMEPFYPLHAKVCDACLLVQVDAFESPASIFSDYVYFSSYSDSWIEHARRYADAMIARFDLDTGSRVVEVASNDGYLLAHFLARGVPVLGVEPAANVAEVAREKGIPTEVAFFGAATAARLHRSHGPADLMAANNVLAHVPDINDFVAGFAALLAPEGVVTFEFPHLLELIRECQFDTIYHEHFSYLSLLAVERILERHGLRVFDVETLPTHGGSLRVFATHAGAGHASCPGRDAVLDAERAAGLDDPRSYDGFAPRVHAVKFALLEFLIEAHRGGKRVAGYGAPAKGNTLLNYCGVGPELLPFTVDRNPHKQGKLLPGTRIPVHAPEALDGARPDYVLILPWNLRAEIEASMAHVRDWGARFVVPIPEIRIS